LRRILITVFGRRQGEFVGLIVRPFGCLFVGRSFGCFVGGGFILGRFSHSLLFVILILGLDVRRQIFGVTFLCLLRLRLADGFAARRVVFVVFGRNGHTRHDPTRRRYGRE